MARCPLLVLVALLFGSAHVNGAQGYLTPTWSKVLAKGGRLLVAEENGRCLVITEGGAIHVLTPSGEVAWRWIYSKISRFIDPQDTAVSPGCDAVAITGSATYKYTWIVERTGKSVAIATTSTPADVTFDQTGQRVAIATFGRTSQVHSRTGELLESHDASRSFYDEPSDALLTESTATIAVSADASRRWLASSDRIACVDEQGTVLAEIPSQTFYRNVMVSRDFGSVVRINNEEKVTTIYRYAVTPPCKP